MSGSESVVREQYCNHDTPAIRDGVCECGAKPAAFPTAEALAAYLVREFGEIPQAAAAAAHLNEGDQYTIGLDPVGSPAWDVSYILARIHGWWLLLPYRSPEAEARR